MRRKIILDENAPVGARGQPVSRDFIFNAAAPVKKRVVMHNIG